MENKRLDEKLQLIREPNYKVITAKWEYKAITRVMLENKITDLPTIVKTSGVEQAMVVDFCNACEEVRLIERYSKTKPQPYVPPVHSPNAERSQEPENPSSADSDNRISNGLFYRIKAFLKKPTDL